MGSRRLLHALLLSVPSVVVLVVAVAWSYLRADIRSAGARLFVGPYPQQQLAFRALVTRGSGLTEAPVGGPLRLVVRADSGATLNQAAVADRNGIAEFNVELPLPHSTYLDLELFADASAGNRELLARTRWARDASGAVARSERGGWLEGQQSGALELAFGIGEGAVAVPFLSHGWVRVTRGGVPVSAARVSVELSGGHLAADAAIVTDAEGLAQIAWIPDEHRVEITLFGQVASDSGKLWCVIPVVPGAMLAEISSQKLRVSSAVPRERAYINWVTDEGIAYVASADLNEQAGFFSGEVNLPQLPSPSWAVVSSEPDAQSMALVGWPLSVQRGPGVTRDLRMRQLVDGAAQNLAERRSQLRRVQRGVIQFVFAAMMFEAGLLLLYTRQRFLNTEVSSDVARELDDTLQRPFRGWFWVSVLVLMLAFGALGTFLLLLS